ncbi:MAG: hypothetical protein L6R39_004691 [Caloplaca ligustica]|nr:MAG: hypothetical protein L6R39_004691 [Caloplaca ligustica]
MTEEIANNLRSREGLHWMTSICPSQGEPTDIISNGPQHFSPDSVEDMVEWADLLLVTCLQADTLAKMLHGFADTLLLRVFRSWNVSKKLAIIPAMSRLMWENPMTRKQLSKIRRKWNWITVLGEPLVWDSKESPDMVYADWCDFWECVEAVENQLDLLSLGHDHIPTVTGNAGSFDGSNLNKVGLPRELWSIILEQTGDWELAQTLGIYTQLPTPVEWQRRQKANAKEFMHELEWVILLGNLQDIVQWLETHATPKSLSRLCVKLIIKFSRTDVLSYLETNFKDLFWSQFGHALLPTKASAIFGQTAVLDWWRRSPSFLNKDYNADALDLASKSGYVHILDWWRTSGLPLRYTDAALEQASAQGQIQVLEWWRSASLCTYRRHKVYDDSDQTRTPTAVSNSRHTADLPPLQLRVGKSLIYAAQNGQAAAIRWWMSSGIPTVHEEAVARTASANGHVNILRLWKELKGEKMQYDNQVLVGPTKNGHVNVLEWWKTSGYRVEYKTCDIEEALEDSVGGQKETRIRSWWASNGLNLGVGTSEWMKVKPL